MFLNMRLSLRNFIDRTFHDEIIAIEEPREWWVEYMDKGRRLEGYIIPVTYKYRGKQDAYSVIDNDHFGLITQERALKKAQRFYSRTIQKLNAKKQENSK